MEIYSFVGFFRTTKTAFAARKKIIIRTNLFLRTFFWSSILR
jgi:hypothetical protein